MLIARPVGLSQDGRSLLVATPSGEEFAIPVDDRLHAALRGDRPRLGQLEIEMDNALGPRDIQARIRAGQSLDEVGRVAGLPLDRVERFAAPVLAEREHVARVAMSSSVRRRGETSGHRMLRLAVDERLQKRGVDIDTVDWDAYRQENGRWTVTARYSSGEAQRSAVFSFDLQGRFSVPDNDEARWLVGEQSSLKGPQPGRRRPVATEDDGDPDTEPTLDLNDELALVRVVSAPEAVPPAAPAVAAERTAPEQDLEAERPAKVIATVRSLRSVPDHPDDAGPITDEGTGSPLDTLAGMLSSDDEERQAVYGGLSDASAVPETDLGGWEPGIVVDYPVEPGPEPAQQPAAGDAADEPPTATSGQPDSPQDEQPARSATKRKRAAVPSWDDIMFGGPPRSR